MAGKQAFKVYEREDSFVIPCTTLGPDGAYEVSKKLLPAGTLEEHAEMARQAYPDYCAATAPEIYDISDILFAHTDCPGVEASRQFLGGILKSNISNTLSCIEWNPRGTDKAIHQYGQKNQYSIRKNLVGSDGCIVDRWVRAEGFVQAVLGTGKGMQCVDNVFYWLTGKHVLEFRYNSKSEQKIKRVVALGGACGGFLLYTVGNINESRPALGVRRAKISEQTEIKVHSIDSILSSARSAFGKAFSEFEKEMRAKYQK